ncbi:DUF6153 family protein [Tersicoccus mangrovi]|uniref:DUF6153 family protein n=1 Tax=Tersicoccus mangrovi TaxID=3121635 RepID=UPI003A7F35F4
MLRPSPAARAALTALAVLSVAFGLIGMHVLGGHAVSTDGMRAMNTTAHLGSTAAAPLEQSPTLTSAYHASVGGDRSAAASDAHTHDHPCAQPGDPQCVPAPGSAPPAPPAIAPLARSDALTALSSRALVPGPRTTDPAPDLILLSISRT